MSSGQEQQPKGPRSDFDPTTVPLQMAATVLVLDDRPDLHVLCLRRRAGSDFVGGMTVFPGGGVDADDADPRYAEFTAGLTTEQAADRLGIPDGFAYWMAVVRETLEETGVLLARNPDGTACDPDIATRHRHAVDRGERTLLEVLTTENVVIDGGAIRDIGRWITPVGPPRRYDTRFFVARMPPGQQAVVDAVEAVHGEWRRPAEALAEWQAGGLVMLPPTVAWLELLDRFTDADDVLAAAHVAHGPGRSPKVMGDNRGSFRVVMPDSEDYDHVESREAWAWVYDELLGGLRG